ncbi:ABC transporter permease [Anaerobacillus alkalidiazotrophicus]|uniref:ABC transporter permease n=1 Tax=Anaerobacillus alkalidiazotrophicus TaxID=472963 RepID=A0A1S2M9Q4_9BACI|nr:ABC transporter permease [Anaerobacillus alkalidiazotrophicus]OIJ21472.1 ABC transporter permease [Anaerobacillus alkalidiazotrophicus]
MWKQFYTQTGRLSYFILRRDRIRIPIWLLSLTLVTFLTANAFTGLYQTEAERQIVAETMRNPAMTAMVGPGFGLDNYTEGAMMAHQMLLFTAIVVAIMSILLVTRHTRNDEEEGRIELIRSLPVGRLSNLSAPVIVLFIVNVILTLLIGFGLYSLGIESMDLQGSLLYGAALGATGIFFTSITALFAQLSSTTRGTIGYAFTLLMIAYLIRAVGDVSNEILSWFSPLGWILQTQVYVNNDWWPIIFTVVIALLVVGVAFYLNANRDLGAGLLPTKPGRKYASRFLKSSIGLPFRLQRTGIIAWAIGMFILGTSYGSVLGDLETFLESNEMLREMLQAVEGLSLTEQYLTMLMSVIAMLCTIPALMFILKLKGEEKRGHLEHILARSVSRTKIMGSYFFISFVFGSMMLVLAVIGLWIAATGVMDDPLSFETLFGAGMVYLPAMWVMIGVAVLLVGLFPSLTGISWLYLGYSFFIVYLGGLLQFPEWLGKASPFGHVPKLPVEDFDFLKVLVLTIVALALALLGFLGYNKRDIDG